MKIGSIRMLGSFRRELQNELLSFSPEEGAAFFAAKYFETRTKIVLLADKLIRTRETDYLHKSSVHLEVSPIYLSRVLNVVEDLRNTTAVMVHSHPLDTGKPRYSISDDYGEAVTSQTLSTNLENHPPVGSVLVGENDLSGRVWSGIGNKKQHANVAVVDGTQLEYFPEGTRVESSARRVLDRQVKAIGTRTQIILEALDVGVVGLGGTGSNVAEQLARMGVRTLKLVDHDVLEASNLSRLYGSTWKDRSKGAYKADIVSSHLLRINPRIECEPIRQSVMKKEVLELLAECDVIFSCLDRHAPRAVLNELSYQCFIPVIDVGVGLTRSDDSVTGGSVRATLIGPGLPCLLCNEIVRPEMIAAEHLSPSEYESRRAEGYVASLDQEVPSVLAYTTLASSLGTTLFLDLIGAARSTNSASTILIDLASKEVTKIRGTVKNDCVCLKRQGKGFDIPFSVSD